jgi:hypothetical protein
MDATIHAMIEKGGHFSVNTTTSCPADPVEALEKLVFESSKSRWQLAPTLHAACSSVHS